MMLERSPHKPVDIVSSWIHRRNVIRETGGAYMASPETSVPDPGFPEAATVHELLKSLQGIGNEVRLRFLDALRMLYDGNLCYELGYASFHQYCDRELGLARSTSHEYLRVARALDGLPRTRVLFGQGELSWEQVRAITRVATAESEVRWIELAFDETVAVLLAEVREAQRTGRDAPREKRHGLPNLMVRLCLELTLEDKERVRAAFALVSAGPGPDLGEGPGEDARPPLVRWADGILSGAIPAWPTPATDRSSDLARRQVPAQAILYRTCPECRETTLDTPDGPLAVSPSRVDELAPVANRVVIAPEDEDGGMAEGAMGGVADSVESAVEPADGVNGHAALDGPNSPRLARQVVHRDGLACANPGCGRRRNLHAHHIVFRSRGGRTLLSNEVAVCEVCHALIHRGLLEVTGSPDAGLAWRPRPLSARAKVRDAAELGARMRSIAVEDLGARHAAEVSTAVDGRSRELALPADAAPGSVSVCVEARAPLPSTYVDTAPGSASMSVATWAPRPSTYVDTPPRSVSMAADTRTGAPSTYVDTPPRSVSIAADAGAGDPSTPVDAARRVRELADALVKMGYGRTESERRVAGAIAAVTARRRASTGRLRALGPDDEAAILWHALRE